MTAKGEDNSNVSLSASRTQPSIRNAMSLSIDNQMAELVEIKSDVIGLKEEHLGFSHLSKGLVHLSWNQENGVNIANQMIKLSSNCSEM